MLDLLGCEHVLLGGAVKVSSEIWEGDLSESNKHFPTRGPPEARASHS
jgi:hypothetical protein